MAITKATASSIAPAAKGDLVVGSATNDAAVLGVGSNDQVLTADSSTATGLKWATVSAGSNWSLLNAGGTALTGASTITISGISGKNSILILIQQASSDTASSSIRVRLNTDTGSNYYNYGSFSIFDATYNNGNFGGFYSGADTAIYGAVMSNVVGSQVNGYALIDGCNSSGVKTFTSVGAGTKSSGDSHRVYSVGGYYNSSSTISSISLNSSVGNFDNGTIYVYASA